MLPETKVVFRTEDEKIQRVYDAAEEKCLLNLKQFGNDTVLVEGGGYEKIWLETRTGAFPDPFSIQAERLSPSLTNTRGSAFPFRP